MSLDFSGAGCLIYCVSHALPVWALGDEIDDSEAGMYTLSRETKLHTQT